MSKVIDRTVASIYTEPNRRIRAAVAQGDTVVLSVALKNEEGDPIDITDCTVVVTATDSKKTELYSAAIVDAKNGQFTATIQPDVVGRCELNCKVTTGEREHTFFLGALTVQWEDRVTGPAGTIRGMTHELMASVELSKQALTTAQGAVEKAVEAQSRATQATVQAEATLTRAQEAISRVETAEQSLTTKAAEAVQAAERAETARIGAAAASAKAGDHRDEAQGQAQAAAASASSASESATSAQTSADTATEAKTSVEAAKVAAETARNEAQQAASAAASSASEAASSASSASGTALDAASSAASARGAATEANTSATAAQASAVASESAKAATEAARDDLQGRMTQALNNASFAIGEVTEGETVSVTNTGSGLNPVLNFTLARGPKGETGDTGGTGPQGEPGKDGVVTFASLTPEEKASLKGEKGDTGGVGPKGDKGNTGDVGPQGKPGVGGAEIKALYDWLKDRNYNMDHNLGDLASVFPVRPYKQLTMVGDATGKTTFTLDGHPGFSVEYNGETKVLDGNGRASFTVPTALTRNQELAFQYRGFGGSRKGTVTLLVGGRVKITFINTTGGSITINFNPSTSIPPEYIPSGEYTHEIQVPRGTVFSDVITSVTESAAAGYRLSGWTPPLSSLYTPINEDKVVKVVWVKKP